jgi:ABC-type hemin transport system ATPase subunit
MTASGEFDARPVRAFLPGPDLRVDESAWPASVPALAQVLRQGLELPAGLTVLVGENGSGKSTVVETLAEAYGLNPQGGSAQGQSSSKGVAESVGRGHFVPAHATCTTSTLLRMPHVVMPFLSSARTGRCAVSASLPEGQTVDLKGRALAACLA